MEFYTYHLPTQPDFPPPEITLVSDLEKLSDLKEWEHTYGESPFADLNEAVQGADYLFFLSLLNLHFVASGKGWLLDVDPYNFNNLPPLSVVTLQNVNELKSQRIVFELNNQGIVLFKDALQHSPTSPENVLPIKFTRIEDGWNIDFFGLQLVAQKAHFKQTPDDYWCLFRHKGIPEGHLDPFSDEWCGLIENVGHGEISIDLDWKRLLLSVERASQH